LNAQFLLNITGRPDVGGGLTPKPWVEDRIKAKGRGKWVTQEAGGSLQSLLAGIDANAKLG